MAHVVSAAEFLDLAPAGTLARNTRHKNPYKMARIHDGTAIAFP